MGYILELRKQVGHRPLIMTCAGVLLLNEKRELLLQKRADNGLWGYPGGSMELGEFFHTEKTKFFYFLLLANDLPGKFPA